MLLSMCQEPCWLNLLSCNLDPSGAKASDQVCLLGIIVVLFHHLRGGLLESIWIHGGHQVDASVVDEVDDSLVALLVLVAQVLSQVDDQLSAHGLVSVHIADVLELRLTCREDINRDLIPHNLFHLIL